MPLLATVMALCLTNDLTDRNGSTMYAAPEQRSSFCMATAVPLKDLTLLSAISDPWASSIVHAKVRSDSCSSHFCIVSLLTNRSRKASSRKALNSHLTDRRRNSATDVAWLRR